MHIAEILSDKEYDIEQHNIPIIANKISKLMEKITPKAMTRRFDKVGDNETMLKCLYHNACRDSMIRRIRTVCKMKVEKKVLD